MFLWIYQVTTFMENKNWSTCFNSQDSWNKKRWAKQRQKKKNSEALETEKFGEPTKLSHSGKSPSVCTQCATNSIQQEIYFLL